MEEDIELLQVASNDQLYHLFKTDSFTFCLICLEDIKSTADAVVKHLKGTNHAKSIKCVFRGCNPSLVDDVEDARFKDIVVNSVFDISVLLENKTCYVCKRDDYWFCLMCEQNITARNFVDTIIKENIVNHVLSHSHVQKVKEVCFLYRLNANQGFLLLNKSVVYCSICQEVVQCKEMDLLKTAVDHLEMKHSTANDVQSETSYLVKQEALNLTDNCLPDQETELTGKNKYEDFFGFEQESLFELVKDRSKHTNLPNLGDVNRSLNKKQFFEESNICFCLLCKKRVVPVVIGVDSKSDQNFLAEICKHFKSAHRKVYLAKPLDNLTESLIFYNDPDKIKIISGFIFMSKNFKKKFNKNQVVKSNLNYILKTKSDYFCIVCMVSMSPCLDDYAVLVKLFHNHFNSSSHCQCKLEELVKVKQAFKVDKNDKTKIRLTKQREQYKAKVQMSKVKKKQKKGKKKTKQTA